MKDCESFIKPVFEVAEKVDPNLFLRQSIFHEHLLKPVNTEFLPIHDQFSIWLLVSMFVSFVLYAWLVSLNFRRVGHMIGALFGHRGLSRMQREGDLSSEHLFLPFLLLIWLCFSLFVFKIGSVLDFWSMSDPDAIAIFGQVALGLGLLYLGKIVLIKILAWIFKEQFAAKQYLQILFVFNATLCLLFLPMLLIAFFGNPWLQTGNIYAMIFIFALWYIWRGVRCFLEIKLLTKFSYVHNFLYFCTLEIGYYLLVYVLIESLLAV